MKQVFADRQNNLSLLNFLTNKAYIEWTKDTGLLLHCMKIAENVSITCI